MIGRQTVLGIVLWQAATLVLAQTGDVDGCGSLQNHYGPYDYRAERNGKLRIVEVAHFTPAVEQLVRGNTSDYLGDDLSYTLRTSPNHHRALVSVIRFAERTKSPQPPHMQYSVECYFDRAIRFQPDDTVVRSLYAQYLGKQGRTAEAVQQLQVASEFAKDNALSHFNIGLVYFEIKEYDHALTEAHIAARLGLERPVLADMLKSVGKWREPTTPPGAPDEAASATR